MSVSTTAAFNGPLYPNGITTAFPFTFKALTIAEVTVQSETNGVRATVNPALYTVALASEGGTVTFATAPATGPKLYILPNPLFTQQVVFANQERFGAEAVNEVNDRSAVRDILLKGAVERSVRAPAGEVLAVLPPASARANTVVGFNSSGDPIAVALPAINGASSSEVVAEALVRASADTALSNRVVATEGDINALDFDIAVAQADIDALQIIAALAALGTVITVKKTTQALLYADLAHAADTIAIVHSDATASKNDLYVKVGASGSGSWSNPLGIFATYAQALVSTYSTAAAASAAAAAVSAASIAAAQKQITNIDNRSSQKDAPEVFLRGVWLQPISTMATWLARGVNCLVHGAADSANQAETGEAWDAAAASYGFYLIRAPGRQYTTLTNAQLQDYLRIDDANPKVIGWNLPDEPNIHGGIPSYLPMTTAQLQALVNTYRAVSPTKPLHVTMAGYNWNFANMTEGSSGNRRLTFINDIDWWTTDTYPDYPPIATANRPFLYAYYDGTYRYVSTFGGVLLQITHQQNWQGAFAFPNKAKPTFSFINTGAYGPTVSQPTGPQFRASCWSRVINGAAGVFYFPQNINNPSFQYDMTPAEIVTEMATFHANLDTLNGLKVLMYDYATEGRRGRRAYVSRQCPIPVGGLINTMNAQLDPVNGGSWTAPTGLQMQGGFEGIEVDVGAVQYRLVLNLCGITKSLTDARWGLTAVSFAPYDVKCFASTAPTTNILA